jgi:beta-fructofuranosidase
MNRRKFLTGTAAAAFAGGMVSRRASAFAKSYPVASVNFIDQAGDISSSREFFYRPNGGRVGDTIPFFAHGQFRIFHLFKADGVPYDTTWHQVSTTDFVHFTELGEMIHAGKPEDQDPSVATGSVIESGGSFHAFYTGFGHSRMTGKPGQGVMHAVSDDLVTWKKIPEDTFYAPETIYERDDWRDPFVFWNEEAKEYWMLVAARLKTGPKRRRGCTALCKSKDLAKWEAGEPFWAPGLYYTHECPDLFRMGDWWYLLFSEFSESSQTRYRMSRKISGPWLTPQIDTFDTRVFYAGKTASNGRDRYLFGWSPLRAEGKDDGKWEWGGNLVVHQLIQRPTGELVVTVPKAIDEAFDHVVSLDIKSALGECEIVANSVKIDAEGSLGIATLASMPHQFKATTTIRFESGCQAFGFLLKVQDDLDTCYYVRFEPQNERLVFDRWPRPGDIPYLPGLERSIKLMSHQPLNLKVIVDGTIAEIYVNDEIAMSTRMYSAVPGQIAVFAEEGRAAFEQVSLHLMNERGYD